MAKVVTYFCDFCDACGKQPPPGQLVTFYWVTSGKASVDKAVCVSCRDQLMAALDQTFRRLSRKEDPCDDHS